MSTKAKDVSALNESLRGLSPSSIRMLTRAANALAGSNHQEWFVAIDTLLKRGPAIIEMFAKKPPASLVQISISDVPAVPASAQYSKIKDVVEIKSLKDPNFAIILHPSVTIGLADVLVSDLPPAVLMTIAPGKEVGFTDIQEFSGSTNDMHLALHHVITYLGVNSEDRNRCHYFFMQNAKGQTVILKARPLVYEDGHITVIISLHEKQGFRFEKSSRIVVKIEDPDKKEKSKKLETTVIKAENLVH
jgi:hypothetical protein